MHPTVPRKKAHRMSHYVCKPTSCSSTTESEFEWRVRAIVVVRTNLARFKGFSSLKGWDMEQLSSKTIEWPIEMSREEQGYIHLRFVAALSAMGHSHKVVSNCIACRMYWGKIVLLLLLE